MIDSETIKKMKPMKDWVLIEVMTKEGASEGGIILPESSRKLVNYATVLASGPGRKYPDGKFIPNETKEGDTVFIANLAKCEPVQNMEKRFIMLCAEPFIDGIVESD